MKNNKLTYESPVMEYISLEMVSCILNDSTGTGVTESFEREPLDSSVSGSY